MATHKQTIYLHWRTDEHGGKYQIIDMDMSILDNFTLIASQEVEFDIGDFDPRAAELENLEATVETERANHQARINLLMERIGKLKAIGHEGVGDE
ncbi:hypothetical protein [Pseudomonas sp.]|uniref:hypothetical protein n=1 Tax=Pseudomonas sp. TaxID=306 RepID=UPI0025867B93|nr:hypothetical protein [Pseudomonas sp.]